MAISNDDILGVALSLFSQNGYDGTSLQDIADCLKVTKGALFKHYDSKEALWNALIDQVDSYYGEHFGKVKNIPLPNTLEELRSLTLRQVNFTLHDETVKKVRKLLTLGQFRDDRMSALATKHFSGDIEAIYTDIFEHLMKNGKVKTDNSSLLAFDYTAPITVLIHLCDREPEREEKIIEKITEHIEHFLSVYGNNSPTDDSTAEPLDTYLETLKKFESERPYGGITLPAGANEIKQLEEYFKFPLPAELRSLLLESNGDGYLIFSTEQILEQNQMLTDVWSDTSPDILKYLFFAENGCGDYYGYRRDDDGCYGDEIYLWEHETLESTPVAASLIEFIEKYYHGEI